jgi:hypothetical protein
MWNNRTSGEPKHDRPENRQATRFLLWILAGVGVVALIGIILISTAPMNGEARNNLGVGLLTGVIVGLALVGTEYALDRRREARALALAASQRIGFVESARLSIADLVVAHVQHLAMKLMSTSDIPDARAQPAGWQGESDKSLVVRGLMWVAELPAQDPTWWRTPRKLAAVDAIFLTATDVAERCGLHVSADELNAMAFETDRAVSRISIAAERLSESGDPYSAHELDRLSDELLSGEVRTDLPDLGDWGTADFDSIITVGGAFHNMREFVAYLIDQLWVDQASDEGAQEWRNREDDVAIQRWGELLTDTPTGAIRWGDRFLDGSWLRALLEQASTEIRATFLDETSSRHGRRHDRQPTAGST